MLDVNTSTFESLGTELVKAAKPDGILVMDEIGFMESEAPGFRKAVTEAFDGDIHILAAIKDTDKRNEHIENILHHPGAELIMLTEENRRRDPLEYGTGKYVFCRCRRAYSQSDSVPSERGTTCSVCDCYGSK